MKGKAGFLAFVFMSFLFIDFNVSIKCDNYDLEIVDFYSCDRLGNFRWYFEKDSKIYFNLTIRNLISDPKNVSISVSLLDELLDPIGGEIFDTTIPSNDSEYYIINFTIPLWAHVGRGIAYANILEGGVPIVPEKTTNFYIGVECIDVTVHVQDSLGNPVFAQVSIWHYGGSIVAKGHTDYLGDFNTSLILGEYATKASNEIGLNSSTHHFNVPDTTHVIIIFYSPIKVPQDFPTIQEAINAANPEDTILVSSGTYYEHVVVNKTVSLIGENRSTTIINGNETGTVVTIDSDRSLLCNFTIQNGDWGVWFDYTHGSVLKRNDITDNARGNMRVSADPWWCEDFFNDVDSSNTVDGKPVCWWTNQSNKTVPSNVGCVILVYSTNITVQDLILSNNDVGVLLACTKDSIVQNVSTNGNWMAGIYLIRSNNNTILGNRISSNRFHGIHLNPMSGHNTIIENEISNNSYGIWLENGSGNNTIYHNTIVNNTHQNIVHPGCINSWDDGYPSGGNYWGDHNPPDLYSGPYQNETGRDKIGDVPYIMDGNNTDRYPLIYPYGYVPSPDVNDDGIVDIFDVVIAANAFGSKPSDPNWSPYADLNQDGIVDIFDFVGVASHFGETW